MNRFILLFVFFCTFTLVAQQAAVSSPNLYGIGGNTVLVPVNATNFNGIGAITLKIQYNPAVLTWVGETNVNALISGALVNASSGVITIAWDALAGMSTPAAKLLDLQFTYVSGTSAINYLDAQCELADLTGNPVAATYTDGSVAPLPAPGVPVLVAPADNALNQPINPTFSWTADTLAQTFRLQVATDNAFTNVVFDDATLTTTSKQVTGLLNDTQYFWRVSATGLAGTSAYAAPRTFTTILVPPAAPVLTAPANNALNQPIALTLSWNASATAATYRVQVATDNAFTNIVVDDATLTGTSKAVSGLLNSTQYFWRVSATNVAGTSSYSTVWNFTTIIAAPVTPALVTPANNAVNQAVNPTLTWASVTGAATYHLQVSTNAAFSSFVYNDSTLTGVTKQLTGLSNSTQYYWRVRAKNIGGTSAFSAAWNFTTIIAAPLAPTLVTPANNAVNQPINPTFTWNASATATTYRLQVATNNTFTNIVFDDATLTALSKQVTGLLNSTQYFWRVSAANLGGSSSFSEVWNLTTIIAAPVVPTLVTPANNAVNQPLNPTLTWGSVTGAATYHLQVATNNTFTNIIFEDATLTGTSKQLTGLPNLTQYFWRVSATNLGGTSAYSAVWNFTTIIATPVAPTLVTPANNAVNQPINPTFTWNSVAGAATYRLQVSTNNTFTNIVFDDATLTTLSKQVTGLLNSTQYFWRVSATNVGGTSPNSEVWNLTTIIATPVAPALVTPANNAVNQPLNPTLTWGSVTGAATYHLQVATNNTFTNIIFDDATLTGTSKQLTGLTNLTQYFWRVSATNIGGTGAYSEVWNFTTIVANTTVPVLVTPANNAVNQPINPTFTWNASANAATYRLQVSTNNTFTNIIFNDSTITGTTKQVTGLLNSTQYFWRVNAKNAAGTTAYSEVWNFTTIVANAPAPILVSPVNNAVNQPINPTFTWNASTNAVSYRLQVATNNTFTNLVFNDSTITGTTKEVTGLLNSTQYFWRVNAKNVAGTSAYSEVWNFTTIVGDAAAPVLVSPVNNAVNQPIDPTLTWNASTNAATYRLQVATDAAFTALIFNDSTLTGVTKQLTGLANSTQYFWRVNAKNAAGTTAYSEVWNFTTIVANAPAPVLVSPVNNAVNQPINPTFTWNASTNAVSYRLQVATDAAFTAVVFNDSTITGTTKEVTGLLNSTQYFWRVNAKNVAGTSAYSEVWNFTTIVGDAAAPVLVSPPNNAVGQSIDPTLTWTASTNAATYRLEVATDAAFTALILNDSTLTGVTKQLTGLQVNQQYFWRVNAKNAAGTSPYSEVWNFTTAATVGWANVQQPGNAVVFKGDSAQVFVRVYARGITDAVGQGEGITAWIGGSATNTNPATWSDWLPVTYHSDVDSTDQYAAHQGSQLPMGTYYYASRFQLNDGTFVYGGYSTNGGGFWNGSTNRSGVLYIIARPIATPTNLTAANNGEKRVALNWKDNANNELNYVVERKLGDSTSTSSYEVLATLPANSQAFVDSIGLNYLTIYTYRVSAINDDTTSAFSNQAVITTLTEVDELSGVPEVYSLYQNYPNPFNPSTVVRFGLPENSNVQVQVFNVVGELVHELVNSELNAGYHEITWNAVNMPSSIYFIRIHAQSVNSKKNFTDIKKALLVK